MKKYLVILSVSILAVFTSCSEDNLNLSPHASVGQDQALNTVNDFENALNGLYIYMMGKDGNFTGSYSDTWMSFPDVLSDNVVFVASGRQTQKTTYEWRYNANNTQSGIMVGTFRTIQHANFILENIDKLDDGPVKNNIIAQAKAVRALAHFQANNVFGKIPTQSSDANASLGVPVMTSSDIRQKPARNTVAEVYAAVITDLLDARSLISAGNGITKMNANAINGLLSRVYLYNGQYAEAAAAAELVTTQVASEGNFPAVWTDASDAGVILKLKNFDTDTKVQVGVPYSQTLGPGNIKSEFAVEYEFAQLFSFSDVRRNAYILTGAFEGNDYNHVAKYLTSSVNTGSGVVDIKVIRAAEVLLNKAEAYANTPGGDASALVALNELRAERYTGFVPGNETGQTLKDAIQLERRLELAFEGHRFFDIKRQGLGVNRSTNGDYADGGGTVPNFLQLPAGDLRFQLPIPKGELDVNPNMVQNPY